MDIAQRQQAPVIVLDQFQPVLKLMRWGLSPSWAKDESIRDKLINAREPVRLKEAKMVRFP